MDYKIPRCQATPMAEHQESFTVDGVERLRWRQVRTTVRCAMTLGPSCIIILCVSRAKKCAIFCQMNRLSGRLRLFSNM